VVPTCYQNRDRLWKVRCRKFFHWCYPGARSRLALGPNTSVWTGTLIEAWASHRVFNARINRHRRQMIRASTVDFTARSGARDAQSTTDPDARLARKSVHEAKLHIAAMYDETGTDCVDTDCSNEWHWRAVAQEMSERGRRIGRIHLDR